MNTKELLEECADVIAGGIFLRTIRPELLEQVNLALAETGSEAGSADALSAAKRELHRRDVAHGLTRRQQTLVDRLRSTAGAIEGPRYMYHGTTYGRLASIRDSGLKAGSGGIWDRYPHLKSRCAEFVFLADRWRIAAFFASASRASARGPRISRARLPVVLRMNADNLSVEPDPLAALRGCWTVRGPLAPADFDVTIGGGNFLPQWVSLDVALSHEGITLAAERGRALPDLELL